LRPESKPEFGFFLLFKPSINETKFRNSALIAAGFCVNRVWWSLNLLLSRIHILPLCSQMPYQTDRQAAFDALHQAFLVNLMAKAEAEVN